MGVIYETHEYKEMLIISNSFAIEAVPTLQWVGKVKMHYEVIR